jgi:hypothetical protein
MAERKPKSVIVQYTGAAPFASVPGFYDGKGYYKKEEKKTFTEPEDIKAAKDLVKNNPNFEEVEK